MMKNIYFLITTLCIISFSIQQSVAQGNGYFFIDDIYQRSYFNPALNDSEALTIASGFGVDFNTNGPGLSDFLIENDEGGLLISAANAIPDMNAANDIFGNASINTIDVSIPTSFGNISIGHAWKATGWFQYTQDLASFVTFGNGNFIGETLQLAPNIDYQNYNEIYIGYQKSFGPLSIGARVKKLNGVETISTNEGSTISLFTSNDIYQLTLESDFELRTSQAFTFNNLEDFDLNLQGFSTNNLFSNNGGWAFDLGASIDIGKLELSASIVDIGSINWDAQTTIFSSNTTSTFEGIDVGEFINTEDGFVVLDSVEALLGLEESDASFSSSLPSQINLGVIYSINDQWAIGALARSIGTGDRNYSVLSFNVSTAINTYIHLGATYSIINGTTSNIGLNGKLKIGPVSAFLSSDNILQFADFRGQSSSLRAGLSISLNGIGNAHSEK